MSDRYEYLLGESIDQLGEFPENCFDAVLTDPPYGLGAEPPIAEVLSKWVAGEVYRPKGRGFMGEAWDAFVPGPEVWKAHYRVLKPGAHLAVFAGTRTMDWMSLALRLAGFERRDTIGLAGWFFGTGYPKSVNIGRHVDMEFCTLPGRHCETTLPKDDPSAHLCPRHPRGDFRRDYGTALKPAFEPILLFRKPLSTTLAETALEWGTGGLNIPASLTGEGSWPTNLVLTHHPNCGPDGCVDVCPTSRLDEQGGVRSSGSRAPGVRKGLGYGGASGDGGKAIKGSQGGASRFYPQFHISDEDLYLYCAKASRAERDAGLEAMESITGAEAVKREEGSIGVSNPRAGAGRTAKEVKNFHPCVKPLALMEWLATLITPPGGTILDSFVGSGTTIVAGLKRGFNVLGIDREPKYREIGVRRAGAYDR